MHMMHNTITNRLLAVTASNWMAVMRHRWLKTQKRVYTCSENFHCSVTKVLRNKPSQVLFDLALYMLDNFHVRLGELSRRNTHLISRRYWVKCPA